MSIYAIFLNEPDEEAWERLRRRWNKRLYVLTDRLAFVAPGEITLTEDIANEIGMNEDEQRTGIVIESSEHSGFNRRSLWEWMRKFS